jgi:hypothetical protein
MISGYYHLRWKWYLNESVLIAQKLWKKYGTVLMPDAPSLTTDKPVTCSKAIARFPAALANDGRVMDTNRYWAMDAAQGERAWWQVDLEKPTTVGRVVVVGY